MKNYFGYSFFLSITTLILLGLFWFIPGYKGDTMALRRLNIVSDLFSNAQMHNFWGTKQVEYYRMFEPEMLSCTPYFYTAHMVENIEQPILPIIKEQVQVPIISQKPQPTPSIEPPKSIKTPIEARKPVVKSSSEKLSGGIVPIDMVSEANFSKFLANLKSGKQVRIAVLGDSFIEGDIFTQDLREQLQSKHGGAGVGYVPITSQVAGFRRTVGHTFSGWTTQCISSAPTSGAYHLAGYVFTPSEGAWVHYKGSNFKSHLASFKTASLLFINKANTKITAIINDTITETFTPTAGEQLQKITVSAQTISSVRFKVSNVSGFKCYGALLDNQAGVNVDNYSIRSYAGAGLAHISPALAATADKLFHYDLIILQYGLNVASATTTRYTNYSQQMVAAIAHLRRIVPTSAILLMSVSDRVDRSSNKTLTGIKAMEQTQRDIAQQCAIPFWSTLEAMQNEGGMSYFVKRGWAAKDFTHLSSAGGKVVARKMVEALYYQ